MVIKNDELNDGQQLDVISNFWKMMWADYCTRVPQAKLIENALRLKGEVWKEDHVAFRCLPGTPCDAEVLRKFFEAMGYVKKDDYRFEEKKLNAFWMCPPVDSATKAWEAPPKVFISELDVSSFPESERKLLQRAIEEVRPGLRAAPALYEKKFRRAHGKADPADQVQFINAAQSALTFTSGKSLLTSELYGRIRDFSEYAAWTLVFGVCVNHFTVSVHLMKGFEDLAALNQYLKETVKIDLNRTGGTEIKGSPAVLLEQSATLAAPVEVAFATDSKSIPYAFIEFAYRFLEKEGLNESLWNSYFQGFVEGNADRIFSSTDPLGQRVAKTF